ncbi:PKD-like domain-containing protein [Aquimarina longa]|uniref:PKD-like domain-containing protein n=1 Tax=Aquimarina longa TaxID=1080221 RepID=UPI000785D741|nr:PKD-like domain-containing protein [Aquimarina longa]
MKKYYILLSIIVFNSIGVYSQLSDLHYLPPLKQGSTGVGSINQQRVYLSTPEATPFDVKIYRGTNATPIATITNLSNTSSKTYNLANGNNGITLVNTASTGTVLNTAGLRFETLGGQKFYVNYRGRSNSQAASLTSKGKKALGTSFKWGGRPNYGNGHNTLNAVLGIMATQDNTTVTIFDYGSDCTFRSGNTANGITADNLTIVLNAGQSYVLEAPRNNGVANIDCWLGASIQSNKQIAISNGNLNGAPLPTSNSRDAGIDQPVPENVLGREYVFVRANGSDVNETPIIIGTQNGTDIFVNGSSTPITTINKGDYFVIPGANYSSASVGGNMYVTASKEIYAYQNIAGSSGIQTGGLNFIAPVNCLLPYFMDNIHNIRNIAGLNFAGEVIITASSSTLDTNIKVTDGNGSVTLPPSVPVTGTSDWKTITVSGLTGDVKVESTGPVAVGFFGVSGNAGVAGYFSGFDTVPVVELDTTGGGCLPGADIFEVTDGFDAYQWFQNGNQVAGATTNAYSPSEPGNFYVRVTRGACTYDSSILSVYNCDPEIVLTKTVDKSSVIEGETVTFTITVEQLGINPATNLIINDALPTELTFGAVTPSFGTWVAPDWIIGDMYRGEVHTLTVQATVNEVSIGSTVTNTISNSQTEIEGDTLPDDETEDVTIINNELEINKVDRPAPDGSYDTVGEVITYDFVIKNTGSQVIPTVTLKDPNIDIGSLSPISVTNLAVGASANFTATHTITQADIEADQVVNTAIAEGTLSNGFVISDISDDPDNPNSTTDDPTITMMDQKGALVLEKIAQPAPDGLYDALGEVITYELTVKNTGNVSINNVTITDSNADVGSINPVSIANLPAGTSAVFTAKHTIIQADFDNGNATNTATVTGTEVVEGTLITDTSDDPTTITPNDATVVSIPQYGQLDVTKVSSPPADGAFDTVGEVITYTIVATSVGNVSLTNINVVDPNADTIVLQSTTGTDSGGDHIVDSMLPTETATFIATHILTQDDLDTAKVVNTATVGSQDPGGGSVTDISDDPNDPNNNEDDPTVISLMSTPSLIVSKIADDDSNVVEGQLITYTYVVTNTGNVTFDEVSISDIHSGTGVLGVLTLQSTTGIDDSNDNDVDELGPGQTATWTSEYTITTEDITNQTDISNTVTATGTPRTGSITNPTTNETITVTPVETICGGVTLSYDLTANVVDPSITSFSWSAANNPLIKGETITTSTSSSITDTLINDLTTNQDIVYTITAFDAGGVAQDVYTYTVTVKPSPTVLSFPKKTICSEETVTRNLINDIDNFNSSVGFSWFATDNPNITGETTTISTDSKIENTLVNMSASPQDVVYTITPTSKTGCQGTIYTYTVTVNPKPVATTPTDTVCSAIALNHDLSSDVNISGSTFSWLAGDNPNVSGETTTTTTTTTITDVLTNTSGSIQTVIYTITPKSPDGCFGDPYKYTVTINPEPFVAKSPTDTVCSASALNHDLSSDVNISGSTFSWLAGDNPNVSGETTTTTTTTTITDVLTNTSGSIQTVIYTITPKSPDGCFGDPYKYTVTINPEPFVAKSPIDTVCSAIALNHDLSSDVNVSGSTFSWLAGDNPNVSGETTTTTTTTTITDVLTNTSGSIQTVIYTITPKSPDGCFGDPYKYTVTINPEPFVAKSPTDTVCSASALNHDLSSDINISGSTFSWLAGDNPNVSGETTTTTTTTTITDVLTNTSGSIQTVIYTITPKSPDGCFGDPYKYTVTINPEPFVAKSPIDTVCSAIALNHDLSSDVNVSGSTFSWLAGDNPNVIGETTTTTTTTIITDVLTNTSGNIQTVIYTITPKSPDGCFGNPYKYTVTINPEPFVAKSPTDTVCSANALNHDLSSDVNISGSTFSWLAGDNPNVIGETTTTTTTTTITDVLTNTSGSIQTVIYTITPKSPDGCFGDPYTYTVTIRPEPFVAKPPTDTVCSAIALNHDLSGDVNVSGSTFSWLAGDNPDVTGETTTTTTTTTITDVLTNTSGSIQTVIYTITPKSPDGCFGTPYTYTVTINPEPFVATTPTDTVCSASALNHDLTGDVNLAGTSFIWVALDNPDVIGETLMSSTTTTITDVLKNISGIPQEVTYAISPTSMNGCLGTSFVYSYVVTVNPEPFVATTPTDIVCNNVPLNHDLIDDINVVGSTFSWVAVDNPNVSGETTTTTTTTTITDVLTNTSDSIQTVIYTITPKSPDGCSGDPYTYTVTINPEPFVATAPTTTICSSSALNHDLSSDVNISGSTFSWLAGDNPNVIGETTTTTTTTTITDVLTNTSGNIQTVMYTITPKSPDGCFGTPYTYTVTIRPEPFVAKSPTDTVCSTSALNHDLSSDVNISGTTFSWLAGDNPNVTGETTTTTTTTTITDVLTNTSGNIQTVIYTITPKSPDGCSGDPYTYTVTINPEPFVVKSPIDTVCSAIALNHDLSSDVNVSGSTFSWLAGDNPNVIGETTTTTTTTTITDVLTNTSGSIQTVIYTITPKSSDGCSGDPYTYTVTINPEPFVATAPTTTICSSIALNHDLSSDVNISGSTFSWLAGDNPNVIGETTTTTTTTTITDVLTNTSGSIQTVMYTITPKSPDGCSGTPYTYTVTINPEPFVAKSPTDTVCSAIALNHDLSSDVNILGTTFSWVASDNPNVTGETTTTTTTTTITDVLTNTSGSIQTVMYTITPKSPDGCFGTPYKYTVTINPEPFVAKSPIDTVCSAIALNHDLSSDVNVSGSTFSWLAGDNPNVIGETTTTTTTTTITDVLTNTSGSIQTVIYTITPESPDGCSGDPYTYTVTINPEPFVATAPTTTICSSIALNHDLSSDVNISGSTFSWLAGDNPNVIGETTTTTTTTTITDVLTNTSGSIQTVIYTITPKSPDGCFGTPYKYTVTINPEPFVAKSPTDTVCSAIALNHDLSSDINILGTTFSWVASDNPNVIGETTTTTTTTTITDVLTNTSGSIQTVIYTITPKSPDGCSGTPYTYTVTINPEPFVAKSPIDTVCSAIALNHDLSSDINILGTTFSWVASDNPNVTGETTTTTTTTTITDVLTNTSGSIQTVIYTITPKSPDGCFGDPYKYTVTINPEPFVAKSPTDTVCSAIALNHDLSSDVNISGTTFSWLTVDNPNVIGETTTTTTTTTITDVLTNTSGSIQTVMYTITPKSPDGCSGDPYTYTVTINPEPFVATAPTTTICSSIALNHDLSSDVNISGSTFSWVAIDNPNVTGETTTTTTTTTITDVLTNTSGSIQTVMYTITPKSPDGCFGTPYTYTVTINPEPFVAKSPIDTVCSAIALNHDLSSDVNVSGTTFSWLASDNPDVTGETTTTTTTTTITDVLTNTSGSIQTVIYTITPKSPDGCFGTPYTYTVTINPEPFVATIPTDTVCSAIALNHDLSGDVNVSGSTFSWLAGDNPNVIGETTTTTTTITITDVLTNTSGSIQTVIYTITPKSPDGCFGDPYTYTVTINPEPFVATIPTDTVCSAIALNHDLSSDVNVSGTTFSWLAGDNPNVIGETTTTTTTTTITDVLTNTSGSIQTVMYTITPKSPDGCFGTPYTYTVTINPEPFVATAPTTTICSSSALNHDLSSDVNILGSTFSWLAGDNPNVIGETTTTTTTTTITDVLTNTSGSIQTVMYTITPKSPDGCFGDPYTYTVTINPEPFVAKSPIDTVCSASALNHDLSSDVNVSGSTFSWVAVDNPNVTGETITTTTTTTITDVLTNTSGNIQTVMYTITPKSPDGCFGTPYTYTVTINPEPFVATAPTTTICSAIALNHDLSSDVNISGSTFSWLAVDNPDVTGETTIATTATSITDVLTNISDSIQTVVYTITPTSPSGCTADPFRYTVVVLPQPELVVTKEALLPSDGNYDTVGEVITYTITIQNPKEISINTINITDPNADFISITNIPSLAENSSVTFTATHSITQEDLDNGRVTNTLTAKGVDACGRVVLDISDDPNTGASNDPTVVLLDQNPKMSLIKLADIAPDGSWDEVNEVINYSLILKNTGNVTLTNVLVTDPNADTGSVMPSNIPILNPGQQISITASHTITQTDLDHGSISNSAMVEARDPNDTIISDISDDPNNLDDVDVNGDGDPDDVTITSTLQSIKLDVTKVVDVDSYTEIGDVLLYTIEVINTGNVAVFDIIVEDPMIDFTSINTIDKLAPKESFTVTGGHVVTTDDIIRGFITNTAIVKAFLANRSTLITEDSDDPNTSTNIDNDADGDFEDPTISYLDSDGDGIINIDDLDDDNDGITDIEEQKGDPLLDTDGDGIIDSIDLDSDGDGLFDYIESGHNSVDTDGDGRIEGPFGNDGVPDSVQDDVNGGEVNYTLQDTDGDGIDDFQDNDDDDDAILTADENPDPNQDGIPEDAFDIDNDGIPDYLEPNNSNPNAEDDIEVFNIVTPNGDGDHDAFIIRDIEKFPDNDLKIFNRWGVLVYEARGYGQNDKFFRGISKGRVTVNQDRQLPVGTYFYILTYRLENGKQKKRSDYLYINK